MEDLSTFQLKENLKMQVEELEMLQSMFPNSGEIRIDDLNALKNIMDFINDSTETIPPFLDLTINLNIDNMKFELCTNLSHEYPHIEPDIYIRNHKLNRKQHTELNKEITNYISNLERSEPCIYSAISWLQDNGHKYQIEEEVVSLPKVRNEKLARFWIYSHHIYSKSKRKTILELAEELHLTGFSLPGKPGIICVEGANEDCVEWWQEIKSLNWKRILCKLNEECNQDPKTFRKFERFEEKVFQNNSIKCNHMDMGELYKFLEEHECSYVFKDLFGVDVKSV